MKMAFHTVDISIEEMCRHDKRFKDQTYWRWRVEVDNTWVEGECENYWEAFLLAQAKVIEIIKVKYPGDDVSGNTGMNYGEKKNDNANQPSTDTKA